MTVSIKGDMSNYADDVMACNTARQRLIFIRVMTDFTEHTEKRSSNWKTVLFDNYTNTKI